MSFPPIVGMFYLLSGCMYYVMMPVDQGDRQEEYVSTNTTHYEWWHHHIIKLLTLNNPQFDMEDHEYVPRGRVIFDVKADIYELIVDRCIRKSKRHMLDIFEKMHLPKKRTRVITNFHYRCQKCRNN